MESPFNLFVHGHVFKPDEHERSTFERLMSSFAAHEREERQFLEDYRSVVEQHENPLVRFLLQMIMLDEEKHHALVHTVTSTLNADLTWLHSGEELPKLGQISDEEKEDLLKLTKTFIETEKEGIKEYKALLKTTKDCYGGLLNLLVETIIHDSEKHMMILRFMEKRLRER